MNESSSGFANLSARKMFCATYVGMVALGSTVDIIVPKNARGVMKKQMFGINKTQKLAEGTTHTIQSASTLWRAFFRNSIPSSEIKEEGRPFQGQFQLRDHCEKKARRMEWIVIQSNQSKAPYITIVVGMDKTILQEEESWSEYWSLLGHQRTERRFLQQELESYYSCLRLPIF